MASVVTKHLRVVSAELQSDLRDEEQRVKLTGHIAAIQRGDEAALEQLYHATVDQLFALSIRILGPGPDAEEIVEDVFLYVWKNANRYASEQGHPIAWLITLTRSRAIDRYRYRQKHTRISEALASEPAQATSVEEPLAMFYNTRLRQAIEALPEVRRHILTLAYFRGMTQAEIAEDLSMSLGTVKTHIRRTLMALREEVAE